MRVFTLTGGDGVSRQYSEVLTFHSDDTGRDYILFTDADTGPEGEYGKRLYAGTFDPDDPEKGIDEIGTDQEWELIDSVAGTLRQIADSENGLSEEELRETLQNVLIEKYGDK